MLPVPGRRLAATDRSLSLRRRARDLGPPSGGGRLPASDRCGLIKTVDTGIKPSYERFCVGSWEQLMDGSDVEEIKEFVACDQPVVGLYQLYKNFGALKGDTDAEGNLQHGALEVMNSWGTTFGDKGFAWIGYDTHAKTCAFAYSAEPVEEEPMTASGGAMAPSAGHLAGAVTKAIQAVNDGHVDLILSYQFSHPVVLDQIRPLRWQAIRGRRVPRAVPRELPRSRRTTRNSGSRRSPPGSVTFCPSGEGAVGVHQPAVTA